ncbi:hypothetical protein [Metabacillus sp. B2-18]|uniref:hypothetical protein n=1 Tax=Metabacillus sp. B2-18 TaxID=2897333 RepID=UPI001E344DEA|nr:hypothetical protein [Metabacillus sp. B2-18]UGB30467.1 hypothetical protein LPC09_22670 [Metabacillus sp. B2-18]
MSEKKEYLFYKNLVFFWRKKWLLIGIPLVICLIVSAFSMFSSREYVGKAIFDTADIKGKLTDPELLQAEYLKDQQGSDAEFTVVKSKQVQIKVTADNRDDVHKQLTKLVTSYAEDLQQNYQERYDRTQETVEIYEKGLKENGKLLPTYNDAIEKIEEGETVDPDLLVAAATMNKIAFEYETSISRMKTDLLLFDPPRLISETITQSDNYLVQNAVVSFALSFFLMLVVLLLWRYIREARRALND